MMRISHHLAAAMLLLTVTASAASAQQPSDITLKVASFAGPFGEALQKYAIDIYTRRTGVKVEMQFANPVDFLAKMIASRGREPPFDIVCLDDDVTVGAIESNLLAKFDPSIVTNLKYLYPEAVYKDGYGARLFYFSMGIAYRKDKFKEAGIPEPTSWNDLWDPRLAGHVSVPDIVAMQGRDFIIQVARMNGGSEATPEMAIDKISKIKAHSYNSASNTLQAQLESGDVWAAPWNDMRAASMADRGLPVGFVTPKEGSIGDADTVSLVAGSRHPKEAQELINYMISPFAQLGMAKLLPTGPTSTLLTAIIDADPDWTRKAPATAAAIRSLYLPDWGTFNKGLKKATDYWNRAIH